MKNFYYLTTLKFSFEIFFSIFLFGAGKSILFNKINVKNKISNITINLINNLIFNINFGINISAPDSYVSGNVINNFSADGIRVGANNTIVQFNVIKNSIKVNDNHDDGIQGYGGGKGDLIINNTRT